MKTSSVTGIYMNIKENVTEVNTVPKLLKPYVLEQEVLV